VINQYPILKKIVFLVIIFAFLAIIFILLKLQNTYSSLPKLNNTLSIGSLKDQVNIKRDRNGIPSIYATTRNDSAFALGYLHSQERFFQMDILRRTASGQLSVLLGISAIEQDKLAIPFNFDLLADETIKQLPSEHKTLLAAYTKGVNQGLNTLDSFPFEYSVLETAPGPWQERDSILVAYALFLKLQSIELKKSLDLHNIEKALPSELVLFLIPEKQTLAGLPPINQVPTVAIWGKSSTSTSLEKYEVENYRINKANGIGWAISGSKTLSQSALIAINLNMPLSIPNTWFRVNQYIKDKHEFHGVTIPGFPLFLSGSNTHVAWGLSPSRSVWGRLQIQSTSNVDVQTNERTIQVRQEPSVIYNFESTKKGPVVASDKLGNLLSWQWVGNSPKSINLDLLALETSKDTKHSLSLFKQARFAHFDAFVGDSEGNIGWTMLGAIPKKDCFQTKINCEKQTDVYRLPIDYPQIFNPDKGYISTADTPLFNLTTGDMHWFDTNELSNREKHTDDNVFGMYKPDEAMGYKSLTDIRNYPMMRWQKFLIKVLSQELLTAQPQLREYRKFVDNWNGDTSSNSTGYILIRAFRDSIAKHVFEPIFSKISTDKASLELNDYFNLTQRWEIPLWQIINQQPDNFLDTQYYNWQDLYASILIDLNNMFILQEGSLAQITWGQYNHVEFKHSTFNVLPKLNRWLVSLPAEKISGDVQLPKTQFGNFGSTLRLVMSPGHESQSLFSMPIGQSSNPLSPYWLAGHDDWVLDRPTPFLPSDPNFNLTLNPKSSQ
jgi:penicillin amidase